MGLDARPDRLVHEHLDLGLEVGEGALRVLLVAERDVPAVVAGRLARVGARTRRLLVRKQLPDLVESGCRRDLTHYDHAPLLVLVANGRRVRHLALRIKRRLSLHV